MSNNRQSSVELLIEQLEEKGELRDCTSLGLIQLNIDKNDYLALKEQAKAMHKDESISFAENFAKQMLENKRFVNAEIIYNETFGGNK